jgi:RimJ/RimL family protein N-acetyltransferase
VSLLRPAQAGDLDPLLTLARSPDAAPTLSVTAADGLLASLDDEHSGVFAIEHEGALAGAVRWVVVNERSRIADVRTLMVIPALRGRGLAIGAVRDLAHHLFLERGLHRLEAEVFAINVAGQHVFERAGFTREGVRRRAYNRHGTWQDSVIFGLLEDEL